MYDLTMAVLEQTFLLMAPFPEEESRLTAVIRPYSWPSWLMIAGSTVVLISVVRLFHFLSRKRNAITLSKVVVYVGAIFTNQGLG